MRKVYWGSGSVSYVKCFGGWSKVRSWELIIDISNREVVCDFVRVNLVV